MKIKDAKVNQTFYEDFPESSGIEEATVTEWYNGCGIDVYITRRYLPNINIQLTNFDIDLLQKIFSKY